MRTVLLGLAMWMLMFTVAQAQDSLKKVTGKSVEVRADKIEVLKQTSFSSVSIDSLMTGAISVSGFERKFQSLPGVWIAERNNFSQGERLIVRGNGWRSAFGIRGIYLQFGELPLTYADGQSSLSGLDPEFVGKVDIYRGPNGSQFSNASGGALIMQADQSAPFEIHQTLGAYGFSQSTVKLSTQNHQFAISSTQLQGFREHSEFFTARGFHNGTFTFDNNLQLKTTTLVEYNPEANHPGSLTRDQFEQNEDMANPFFVRQNATKDVQQYATAFKLSRFTEKTTHSLRVWAGYRDLVNPLAFAWLEVNRWFGGSEYFWDRELTEGRISGGVDAQFQLDRRSRFTNNAGEKGDVVFENSPERVLSASAWAGYERSFGDGDWTLISMFRGNINEFSLGEGGNRYADSFNALTASFGLQRIVGNTEVYVQAGNFFETPTLNEISNNVAERRSLQAQVTTQAEMGARGAFSDIVIWDVAAFYAFTRRQLTSFQPSPGETLYGNLAEGNSIGGELSIDVRPIKNLRFSHRSSLISARTTKGDRFKLPGFPPYHSSNILSYTLGKNTLMAQHRYSASFFVDEANQEKNTAFSVFDVSIDVRVYSNDQKTVRATLGINNILDTVYSSSVVINSASRQFYEPAMPRWIFAGLSFSL